MNRENNIDCLRSLACLLVIIIHVSSIYLNNYSINPSIYFTIGNLYDSFSRIAVPIFILISGRYALNYKEQNSNLYYSKILKKIYIPTFLWSIIYLIFSYFFIYEKSWKIPIRAFIEGVPFYHMWYPYMCILLYFLTPYLVKVKKKYGERSFLKIGIIFLILGIFLSFIQEYFIYIDIYSKKKILIYFKYFWYYNYFKFILYLGYFILGYSLRNLKISRLKGIFGYCISSFLLFFLVQRTKNLVFYNYNFILTVFSSFLIYFTFNNLNIKFNFSKISQNTFNIYLIHAGVLYFFQFTLGDLLYNFNPIFIIPIVTILVFIFSFFISNIINSFFKGVKNG